MGKRACVEEEGEEELLKQYETAELPDALPTNPNGVLARKEVSISPLFPAEDREIAAEVVRSHGGNSQPKERGLEYKCRGVHYTKYWFPPSLPSLPSPSRYSRFSI